MPRIINIYKALLKCTDIKRYLIELKDYKPNSVTFGVFSNDINTVFKLEDTIPLNRKASTSEENLVITDLTSGRSVNISEENFLKNFPEFLL